MKYEEEKKEKKEKEVQEVQEGSHWVDMGEEEQEIVGVPNPLPQELGWGTNVF